MSQTSVASDFEQSFNILSKFGLKNVGGNLKVLSFLVIFLPVQEPSRHTMTFGIVNNISDRVTLRFSEFSSSEFRVDSEYFAYKKSKPSSNSLDFFKGEGNSPLTIDIGVENTMNMFESVFCVFDDQ